MLFHVTANANWSNLPLSGLFLDMLQRVAGLDAATTQTTATTADANFAPRLLLAGDGSLTAPDGSVQPLTQAAMEAAKPSLSTPPGIYVRQGRERALNHTLTTANLAAMNSSVGGASVQPYTEAPAHRSRPPALCPRGIRLPSRHTCHALARRRLEACSHRNSCPLPLHCGATPRPGTGANTRGRHQGRPRNPPGLRYYRQCRGRRHQQGWPQGPNARDDRPHLRHPVGTRWRRYRNR